MEAAVSPVDDEAVGASFGQVAFEPLRMAEFQMELAVDGIYVGILALEVVIEAHELLW